MAPKKDGKVSVFFALNLERDLHAAIRQIAAERGVSMAALIRGAVQADVEVVQRVERIKRRRLTERKAV